MITTQNRVMMSDSYKYSHSKQYPKDMVYMFDYMESRSNKFYNETFFFGLQYYLKQYFSMPIEKWEVEEAKEYADMHGIPFDYNGWIYIVEKLNGKLPVKIRAVPEGSIIPNKNIIMSIESTDENVPWIVGWMETILMKLWYPITVATKSREVKKIIKKYDFSSDEEDCSFSYHNFGDRGSSSVETAAIGGMAHLTQFMGTDNFYSLKYANIFYKAKIAGFSIPATEHSTVTSAEKENRFKFYMNYIEKYKDYKLIACVMDSYDIYGDVEEITKGEFKKKIESDKYPTFVIRPDSGQPIEVMNALLNIMEDNSVSYFINKKGYKVFNKYKFIWGDGITPEIINKILEYITKRGYSRDIINFGSGGDIMQNVNRDNLGFAIKCSHIKTKNKNIDIFKDPITDYSKKSKKGILELYNINNNFITDVRDKYNKKYEIMNDIYLNGKIIKEYSFDEIRSNFFKI